MNDNKSDLQAIKKLHKAERKALRPLESEGDFSELEQAQVEDSDRIGDLDSIIDDLIHDLPEVDLKVNDD